MSERHPRPGSGWDDLLEEALRRSDSENGSPHSLRRSLSVLSDNEREQLDGYLSGLLKEDESEAMAGCLQQLEDLLEDRPQALELLEHVRQDIARTALHCIEQSYRYGKRYGQKEALDILLPYIRDLAPAS